MPIFPSILVSKPPPECTGNPIAYLDRVYADTDSLARGVLSSDRGSLARAITLVESTRVEHQKLVRMRERAITVALQVVR